MITSLSDVLHH